MKLTLTVSRLTRADRFLAAELPFVHHVAAQKLFRKKDVKAAGRALRPDEQLAAGTVVDVFLPDPHTHFGALTGSQIIFEDDDTIVWDKAAGTPTVEGVTTHSRSLKSAGERLLGISLTAVHRLDKDTSGVIIFAKKGWAGRRLEDAFRTRQTTKIYHAIVEKKPREQSGIITLPLAKVARKVIVDEKHGLSAETAWRVIGPVAAGWLLECTPRTGRTHQIRVHLASIGSPIVGDELYGHRNATQRRHLLHASSLTILDRTFTAPLPTLFGVTPAEPERMRSHTETHPPRASH